MKPNVEYQNVDMLDLIFANRNKSYGAYALRREYPATFRKSFLGAFLIFGLFIGIPVLMNYISLSNIRENTVRTVQITLTSFRTEKPKNNIDLDKLKLPKQNISKPLTTQFKPPVIVEDPLVKDNIATIESIKSNTGIETVAAVTSSVYVPVTNTVSVIEETEKPKDEIVNFAEVLPAFPGGDQALLKYLTDNTKYPGMTFENRIMGKVIVSFVVGSDGLIKDVKVKRGIGAGLDEEAVRVVKSMPRWTPGKQNGKPVNVMYNLPINFILKD